MLTLGSAAIYLAALILLSWHIGRGEDREGFLIAGRDRGSWPIFFSSMAGSIGAGWLLSYTALAFQYGMSLFYALAGYVAMFVLFALWAAPRIHRYGRRYAAVSLGEWISGQLQAPRTARLANIYMALAMTGWIVVSLTGGAKILENLGFPGGYVASVWLISLFAFAYIALSGLRGVILTDLLQSLIMISFLVCIAGALVLSPEFPRAMDQVNEPVDPVLIVGMTLMGLNFFAYLSRYQLCFAAASETAARRGLLYPVVPILLVTLLMIGIGQYAKFLAPDIDPDLAFLEVMRTAMPGVLLSMAVTMFMAAIMSSMDTNFYAAASHLALSFPHHSPRRIVRYMLGIMLLVSIGLALALKSMLSLTFLALALTAVPSLSMIYLVGGGTRKAPFIGGFVGGLLGLIAGWIGIGLTPALLVAVYGLSLPGLLIGLLIELIGARLMPPPGSGKP